MALYRFTLDVKATDESALHAAALARLIAEGIDSDIADESLREDGEIDAAACIRALIDPVGSFPGTEIQDSACEYLGNFL